jgi:queuine tRNA-ribosyltransferase
VKSGFDMFDCVLATRLGRHGTIFWPSGNIKISNARYKSDHTPLNPEVDRTPAQFTKAYLHHLVRENEMLGASILSLYNILYLHHLCQKLRKNILISNPCI